MVQNPRLRVGDNNKMGKIVFWQNIVSPHQAPFIRALAAMGHEIVYVAAEEMEAERRQIGWSAPHLAGCEVTISPSDAKVKQLIHDAGSDAIHVLAGARWLPLGDAATKILIRRRAKMGVLTESPDPRGVGGWLRLLKYSFERIARGRNYDFLLCMGRMGVDWFKRCGYKDDSLFPFCYVTESKCSNSEPDSKGGFRMLFVGRLVKLKGLDLLFEAVSRLRDMEFSLTIIGDGVEKESLMRLSEDLGISNLLIWRGQMEASGAMRQMMEADLLVLPSRKDGWGAVVNEALSAGTPVVCSSACGSADLLTSPTLGDVFPTGDVLALERSLRDRISIGRINSHVRSEIRQWSKCISGESVANYFINIMKHVYGGAGRVRPPWHSSEVGKGNADF